MISANMIRTSVVSISPTVFFRRTTEIQCRLLFSSVGNVCIGIPSLSAFFLSQNIKTCTALSSRAILFSLYSPVLPPFCQIYFSNSVLVGGLC